jgi:pantothenate synthetase
VTKTQKPGDVVNALVVRAVWQGMAVPERPQYVCMDEEKSTTSFTRILEQAHAFESEKHAKELLGEWFFKGYDCTFIPVESVQSLTIVTRETPDGASVHTQLMTTLEELLKGNSEVVSVTAMRSIVASKKTGR